MDEIFKKFYARLKREGMLKAALCAVAISFTVVAVTAFICWMTEFTPVWICPVTFAVSAGLSFTLFYFLLFRPDFKTTAARMDALGLDERMITMHELAGENSVISGLQRADAVKSAESVGAKMLKICVPAIIIAFAVVGFAVGAAFVTVDALSETGVIKSGRQIADEIANPPVEYKLRYKVKGEGSLLAEDMLQDETESDEAYALRAGALYAAEADSEEQGDGETSKKEELTKEIEMTVVSGEQGKEVRANPMEGWFLAGWAVNDANYVMTDNYRTDKNVTESVTITAVYEELEQPVEDLGPTLPGSGEGDGIPGLGSGDGSGSGIDRDEANNVIDGETNYGDIYNQTFGDTMGDVSGNSSISQGESDIIGGFFDTIAP